MAGPRSVKEIREANGGLANLTDFEIAQHEFKRAGKYYDSFDQFAGDVGLDTGGKWGNRLSASVDSWQAGLQGVGEAVAGSMGLSGTEDIFRRSRRANEVEAQNARQLAQSQGAVMSYKDANSLGDYADWAGGMAVDSLPYLGEALAGGIAGRALLTGGRLGLSRAAAGQVGTTMASYPSAVGDILQNQRDENGTTDLGSAAVGGVPYALANGLFGLEGAIGRGSLARSGFAALDDLTDVRGALARTGATAGRAALSEGASETAQEGVNQYFGRMAVNPDETLFNPEANDRYLESFVGGATLGGLVGGGAGGWRRSEGYTAPTVDDPAKPTNLLGGTPPNLVTDMGALPPLQDRINQNLGLNLTGAPKGYAAAFVEAYDTPSGVRLPDPETGVERELSMGELRELQAAQYQVEVGGLTGDTAGLPPTAPVNLITDTSALLPLQQRIDQNLGLNLPGAPKNYPSQFQEAASEPTNQWVVDPQTGMEHRLDIGQVTAIRAGDNTQLTPEQQNIKAKADELAAARTAAHNTFMGPAVDGAWPLKLQPREVSTYRTMDQLRQQGVMSQAAFEEMAGSVQEALMAEDTKTLNKINKDITAELAKRLAPAQEQIQGDTPSTQQTAPAAQPTGLQLNFGDEATAVPGEAKPAPVVGLQRKATAPTTPFVPAAEEQVAAPAAPVEPATPVATEAQPTAPVAGTSPAAGAWQQVVAQAQALQIPVPPYESLRADQQKQVEDLVAREQFNMAAADTVLRMPEPAAKPAPAVGLQRKATAPTTPFVPAAEEQVAAPVAPVEPATPVATEAQPTAGTAPIRRAKPAPAAAVATAFRAAKSELKPVVVEANAAAAKQLKALKSLRPNQSNRPKDPEAAAEYDRKMAEFNAAIPNRADVERGLLDVFLTTTDDRRISWIEKATGYFVDTSSGVPVLRQNNQPATNAQIAEEELFEGGIEGKVLSEEDKKALRAADSNISKWLTSRGLYKEVIDRLGAPTDTKEYSDAELGINSAEDAAAVGIQVFDDATKASGNVSLSEKYHKRVKSKVDLELKALEAAGFSEDAIKAAYARLNGLTYKDTDEATAGEVVQDAEGEFADAVGLDATEQNPDGAVVDPDTADTARDSKYNPYTAALAEALADQLLVKRKQRTRVDTGDVKLTQAEIEQRKFDSVKAAAQAVRAAVGSMGFSESVASWNDLRSDDAPEFDNLPVVRQAAWVSSYKSFFEDLARGHITEDQFRSAVESEQRSFEAGAVFQQEAELERRVLARRLGANRPDGAGPAGSGVAAPQIDSNADVGTRAKAKLKSVQQNVAKADLTDEELEWAAQTFERLKNTAKAKEARAEQQKRAAAAPVDQAKAVEQAPATAAAPAAEQNQASAPAAEPTKVGNANPIKASMYHGSPNGGLTELRGLTFLTNDVNVATQYAKGQVFNTGGTEDTGGKVYRVAVSTKNTLDLRKPEHQTAYEAARRIWNKAADVDDRLPPITSEGFVISKTGLPSYGRIATVLNAMPEFDSAFVDEGTQGVSLAVLNDAATPAAEIIQAPDTDTAKVVEQAPATAAAPAAQATAAEPALLNQYNPDEGPSAARSEGQAEQRSTGGSQPGQSDLFYPNGEPTYGANSEQAQATPKQPAKRTVADMVSLDQIREAGRVWERYAPPGVEWDSLSTKQKDQWAVAAVVNSQPSAAEAEAVVASGSSAATTGGAVRAAGGKASRQQAQLGDESNVIDVEARVLEETVAPQVAALSQVQQQQLAQHYGEPVGSLELLRKVNQDAANHAKEGAAAVAARVRHIIRKLRPAAITDESNVIDVEARVLEETVAPQVAALPAAQQQLLAQHYGEPAGSLELLRKVKEDVVAYAVDGAAAVATRVRHIIRKLYAAIVAGAFIFNPTTLSNVGVVSTAWDGWATREIHAAVPESVRARMSTGAQQAYATILPSIREQLKRENKLMLVVDKPNARMFVFNPDGTPLLDKKILLGAAKGDLYKGNVDVKANRITPAGLFTMGLRDARRSSGEARTAGEYDTGTVYVLDKAIEGEYSVTLFHSVWTKESDAKQRLNALKTDSPADSRYSFGCINVDKETYSQLLTQHGGQMDGAALFIVPENPKDAAKFLKSEIAQNKASPDGLTRTPFKPATEVVRTGVASGNEPKTNSQEKAPAEGKPTAANGGQTATAGSTGQNSPRQQQSIGRRTRREARGVDAAAVVEDLKRFLRKDALGHKVIVVQSVSDLPKGIKITSKKLTQGITIDAGPDGRVAYLIADNLTPSQIRPVFMHEVGSHMALDNMLGKAKMDALMGKLKGWAKAGMAGSTQLEHVLANRAMDRAMDANVAPEHMRSEALAYFIEEAVAAGVDPTAIKPGSPVGSFLESVMLMFAKALRLLGINSDKLTAQDVVDMAYGAAQAELHDPTPAATGVALNVANAKFSKAAPAKPSYLSKAPSELADLASGIATSVKDWTFTRGAFTRDLLDAAAKLMPSASKYLDRMQRARVESVKLEREVAAILDDAAALSATERGTGDGSVNSLIRDMTYDGKWAFKPDWLSGVTPDPVLEARFNQLSDKAQDVVMRVFRHGHETLKQVQQAATDSIKSEVEPLIAKARAEGDMKTVKELEREKVKADGKFRRLMEIRGGMPYAPLRRFGNWAVVVKSKMYQDAQARGDKGEMGRLASDGNHYRVEFVPNRLVAAGRANRLREVVGDSSVEFFERSDARLLYGGDSMFSAFSRFRELARQEMEDGEPEVVAALDKTLASMYMALVAETSARTSEFDRKNVAGADKDMLRSFATHGRAMANFIGSLKTSGEVMDTLRVMKREAGEGSSLAEKSTLYSEILRRHSMGLNYEPNQLLDKSLAANSYWSLVTSPSYLLTNLTQPWVVSLPVLAGRFGMGRSSGEMFRAYKEIGRISSRLVDNPDAVKDLPKDVQGAVEELFNRGSIDISLGADLGNFRSGGSSKWGAHVEKAIRFPRTLVERGEMVNRVATAVAAYRLAKSQGMKDEAATNYADKVIYETHGDYSAFNSPRVMRNAVGRFATQFRKFQLIQIALYGRMIRDSLAKLPTKGTQDELKAAAEARAVARRSLAYTLGTTFALGGLTAMPGFTAISFLMGAFGDDDEPDDPEATLRRALGGGAEADLLMRGVPNLLGMNLGNRIGAAGMLSILPYTDLEASREGYKDILMGVAGPFFGGTLPKALDGLGLIRQGDLWKGLEMLAPRGLADVSKGIRFGTEGVTKRNGDVVLSGDDVSFFAVVAQAMGLPTTTITDNQMLRNSQFTADEFYKDRTGQLKRQYVQAYRSGDGAKLREIRAEWQETQQARRRLGFKVQPLSALLKAPQEQRKREVKPLNAELLE